MKTVNTFTDIGVFRNVVSAINRRADYVRTKDNGIVITNELAIKPTIKFIGTVKLHGTNSSVRFDSDGEVLFQSRKHILSMTKDNVGFIFFGSSKKDIFIEWNKQIRKNIEGLETCSVIFFGEWCGGNIQNGVAINGLDKMFVLFA